MIRIVIISLGTFVIIAWGCLYLMQDKMMFPVDLVPRYEQANPPANTVILYRDIEGGKVEAWYCPVPGASADQPAPLLVYFHGNGEVLDEQHYLVKRYHSLGFSVLMVEYRGYGRSAGSPGQLTLREDLMYFWPKIMARPEVDCHRVVLHGRSLGGAVAADLSQHVATQALVIQSGFYNSAAMAHQYFAPGFLIKNPYRTDQAVATYQGPILLLHGSKDTIIPVYHSRNLAKLSPKIKLIEYNTDHNDMLANNNELTFWTDIRQFLGNHKMLPVK